MNSETFDISLPADVAAQLYAVAKANGISRSDYITMAVQKQLLKEAAAASITDVQADDVLPASVKLYCDGGSRGNPGASAGGFVILDMQNNVLRQSGKFLGIATNNYAEYHSLKGGLEMCQSQGSQTVDVYMDSLLVINQMKGLFKVKHETLIPIHTAIKKLLPGFKKVTFTHVPRELNKLADEQVNITLDALLN